MRTSLTRAVILFSVLCAAANASAQVQASQGLARVGPTSPATGGFPTWYQDKTGLTLEFCSPTNALELDGGWCLLLPGDTVAPETFPNQFADEHFFFAADSAIADINGLLVLGLEAAFAVGPVVDGDQMVFARIRIRFDAPVTGTYTVYHPYGMDLVDAVAGERASFTDDFGIQCPRGTFDCALAGRMGPFLLPSLTPGGTELPAVAGPVPGKLYIADPAREGPVTGSPINQNFFRIVGPNGQVWESSNFTLMGRIFTGQMPARVSIDKARYSRTAETGKIDVFATGFGAAQPRLPAMPIVGDVKPFLALFTQPCTFDVNGKVIGGPTSGGIQMFSTNERYYATVDNAAIPASVCVQDLTARDINGQAIPVYYSAPLVDQVTITQARYNPAAGGTLTVSAVSSDAFAPPVLTAALIGDLVNGTATGEVGVPPLSAGVRSARGGRADLEITTDSGMPVLPAIPLPGADSYTANEDGPAFDMNVLANDTIAGTLISDPSLVTLAIAQPPALGTVVVNANGTLTYTPNPNANGLEVFTYTVTIIGGQTSAPGIVSVNITPVPDAPVANDDSFSGAANTPQTLPLILNDTDADNNIVGINIISAPATFGLTYTVNAGNLIVTGPAGTHTFTYAARDAGGLLSNVATVQVNLIATEQLNIVRAEYIQNKRRWRVDGTSDIRAGQTVYVMYADGVFTNGAPAVGTLIGQTVVDATGVFVLDFALAGANDIRNPASGLFLVRPTRVYVISTQGGTSPTSPIVLR